MYRRALAVLPLLLIVAVIPLSADAAPRLRMTRASFKDGGESATLSIDTAGRADCDGDDATRDPEPFTDAVVGLTFSNGTLFRATLSSLRYTFRSPSGARHRGVTGFSNIVTVEARSGSSSPAEAIVFMADPDGTKKALAAGSTDLSANEGVGRLTMTVSGRLSNGRRLRVRKSVSIHPFDVDRCE